MVINIHHTRFYKGISGKHTRVIYSHSHMSFGQTRMAWVLTFYTYNAPVKEAVL